MNLIKQSTARTLVIGPAVDATDGVTPETGLTAGGVDEIGVYKHEATALTDISATTTLTHRAGGIYTLTLAAGNVDTLGSLLVYIRDDDVCLPIFERFTVVPANVYDALVGGSDFLQVDTVQIEGSDATDQINAQADQALADYDPPTKAELDAGLAALNDLSAAEVNAQVDAALADYDAPTKAELDAGLAALNDPTAAAIADAVWDEAKAGHVAAGSFGEEVQSHALSSEISALNDLSAAEVNAQVDAALADYDAPTKAELDAGLAALNDPTAAQIADAVWTEPIADHSGTAGSTAEALDGATAPSAAAVADAVWDEALSGHLGSGSTGEALNAAGGSGDPWVSALPGSYSAGQAGHILGNIAATINAQADQALADYDPPTKAELDAGLAALNDLSAAEVNAQVDAALADYDAPTKAELDAGLAALNDPTAAAIADAVWDEAKAGHVAAGSFGEEVQSHALSSEISALNDLSAAEVNAQVDAALADYDGPTKAELDAGLAALNDPTAAAIADAVWAEPIADHSGTAGSAAEALDGAGGGGGGNVTVGDITQAALAKFVTQDTGESTAADGSVAKIAQGAAGGNVTVGAVTQDALDDIWSNASRTLTQSASQVLAAVEGADITVYLATTWEFSLTGLGSLSTYDKVYLTVKGTKSAADTKAVLQVDNDTGLVRINAAAPSNAANGSLAVDDAAAGDITVTVAVAETAGLSPVQAEYDVKGIDNDGNVDLIAEGKFIVARPVTLATS